MFVTQIWGNEPRAKDSVKMQRRQLIVHFSRYMNDQMRILNVGVEIDDCWQEDLSPKATLTAMIRLFNSKPEPKCSNWVDHLDLGNWNVQVWDRDKVAGTNMSNYFTEVWDRTMMEGGIHLHIPKVERCTQEIPTDLIEMIETMANFNYEDPKDD